MRYMYWIIAVVLLLCVLFASSYLTSKKAAEELVGKSLDYCQLTESKITIEPLERDQIVWSFMFSFPEASEEFFILTTLWGGVTATNPNDIESRLRRFEGLEEYPYPRLKRKK